MPIGEESEKRETEEVGVQTEAVEEPSSEAPSVEPGAEIEAGEAEAEKKETLITVRFKVDSKKLKDAARELVKTKLRKALGDQGLIGFDIEFEE